MFASLKGWFATHPKTTKALTDFATPVFAALVAAIIAFNIPAGTDVQAAIWAALTPVLNVAENAARRVVVANAGAVLVELAPATTAWLEELDQLAEIADTLDPVASAQLKAWIKAQIDAATA